jgi:hypothetical protein
MLMLFLRHDDLQEIIPHALQIEEKLLSLVIEMSLPTTVLDTNA